MATGSIERNTNWWGLSSTVGLLVLVLCYGKRGADTAADQVMSWGSLVLVHLFGIKATRQRFGWVYLIPLGAFWLIALIGFLVDYLRRAS
jgi:hypothetical protein